MLIIIIWPEIYVSHLVIKFILLYLFDLFIWPDLVFQNAIGVQSHWIHGMMNSIKPGNSKILLKNLLVV